MRIEQKHNLMLLCILSICLVLMLIGNIAIWYCAPVALAVISQILFFVGYGYIGTVIYELIKEIIGEDDGTK